MVPRPKTPPPYRIALAWALAAAVAGCGAPAPERDEPVPLTTNAMWTFVNEATGPFAEHVGTDCQPGGAAFEDPIFEINTDLCNGGTFTQPSMTPVFEGEVFHAVVWHLQLIAPDASEAVIGIALGEDIIFEQRVDIPSDEAIYKPYVTVGKAYPPGTEVTVHVRNHGENSYRFLDFEVGAPSAFPDLEESP